MAFSPGFTLIDPAAARVIGSGTVTLCQGPLQAVGAVVADPAQCATAVGPQPPQLPQPQPPAGPPAVPTLPVAPTPYVQPVLVVAAPFNLPNGSVASVFGVVS